MAEEMFFWSNFIYRVGEMETDGLQSKFFTFYIHLGYIWITMNLILNYSERGIEAI